MKNSLSTYLSYYKNEKKNVGLSLLLTLVQTFALLPIALIIQHVFNYALPHGDSRALALGLCTVLVLFIANSLASLANRHVTLSAIKSTIARIREELVSHSMFSSRAFYASEDLDTIHSRIVQDTERLDNMASSLLTQLIPGTLVGLGLACILIYLNPILFLILALTLPLLYGMGKLLGVRVKRRIKVFHDDFSKFSKGVLFVLKFNELITLSTAEEAELAKQNLLIGNLRSSSQATAWLSTAYSTIQGNILTVGGVIVLLVGGLQVIHHVSSVGSLISFYIALNLLSSSVQMVICSIPVIIEGRESLAILTPLFNDASSRKGEKKPFAGLHEGISFKGVSFDYGTSFSLRDVTLAIDKHEIVGLFGASGSGKSTLINLLLGFYQPTHGTIAIDREPLRDFDLTEYRRRIGVLPQEPLIFPGTIRENLAYGLANASDQEIKDMCRQCNIHDFIEHLPHGYDSDIGNRGVKISGGQKQRIAIARALLRKPDLIILDEPDNNLDEALTLDIIENIKRLGTTMIVISHNRRLIPHLDKALVIRDGTVYNETTL